MVVDPITPQEALVAIASLLLASIFVLGLGGCVLKGPELEVKPPVQIKTSGPSEGKFCPPGQAKKGNC
jgi:hypothetical protein